MIPLVGLKTIDQTIKSVLRQKSVKCEILILRNGIQNLPQGTNVKEREYLFPGTQMSIKEKYEKWLEHANEEIKEELKGYSEKEIEDSFYKDL